MTALRRAMWAGALATAIATGAARAETPRGVQVEVMPSSANSAASVAAPSKDSAAAAPVPGPTGPYEKNLLRRGGTGSSPASSTSASTQPASASQLSGAWDLGNVPIALGAVILVILILRWMAKGIVPGGSAKNSSRAVRVIGRSVVSPKQQLLVVQFGRRLVLVGSAGAGEMSPICQIDDPDEVAEVLAQFRSEKSPAASAASAAKSFAAMFGRAGTTYEEAEAEGAPVKPDEDANVGPVAADELSGLMDRVRGISRQFEKA